MKLYSCKVNKQASDIHDSRYYWDGSDKRVELHFALTRFRKKLVKILLIFIKKTCSLNYSRVEAAVDARRKG